MPGLQAYSVVAWLPDRCSAEVASYEFSGPSAGVVVELEREMAGARQPWHFVAIFAGQLEPLATFDGNRPPPAGAPLRQARQITVVGFWRSSGHSLVEVMMAGDGDEAMQLAMARFGSARELQILAAFAGRHIPLLLCEQRPAAGWQLRERA